MEQANITYAEVERDLYYTLRGMHKNNADI